MKETIVEAGRNDYEVVVQIHELDQETHQAFEELIGVYPPDTQQAFRDVLALPELMTILTAHLRLTVRLGEAYERDPEAAKSRFAELNLEVARKQARARDEWAKELESDPKLREEFEESTTAYAEEHGYDTDDRPDYAASSVYVYPYPYWYGYPFWLAAGYYSYPVWYSHYFWYPYPYWASFGFYYGSHHNLVVYSIPSYFYLSWHSGYRHGNHRYLSDRFEHHFRHQRYRSSHRDSVAAVKHRRHTTHSSSRQHSVPFISRMGRSLPGAPQVRGQRSPSSRQVRSSSQEPRRSHGRRELGRSQSRRQHQRQQAVRTSSPSLPKVSSQIVSPGKHIVSPGRIAPRQARSETKHRSRHQSRSLGNPQAASKDQPVQRVQRVQRDGSMKTMRTQHRSFSTTRQSGASNASMSRGRSFGRSSRGHGHRQHTRSSGQRRH
jgi:hypothetical protein